MLEVALLHENSKKYNCTNTKLLHFHTSFIIISLYYSDFNVSPASKTASEQFQNTKLENLFHELAFMSYYSSDFTKTSTMTVYENSFVIVTGVARSTASFFVGRKQQICLKRSQKCKVTVVCNASSFWVLAVDIKQLEWLHQRHFLGLSVLERNIQDI